MKSGPRTTTIVAIATSVISFSLNEYLGTQQAWSKVPFLWIAAAAAAFVAGTLVQDLYNRDSWLARIWRRLNLLYTIAGPQITQGAPLNGSVEWRLWVVLKAKERMSDAEITVTAIIQDRIGISDRIVFFKQTNVHLSEDQDLTITLASIPEEPAVLRAAGTPQPAYTVAQMCLGDAGQEFSDGAHIWYRIEVRSGFRRQRFGVYFRGPDSQYWWGIRSVAHVREDVSLFGVFNKK